MTTVIFEGRDPKPHSFSVGMQGEHNAETITLEGLPEYGTPVLNVILPDGTGDVLNITDGHVTLTRNHTPEGGTLTAWVTETNGDDLVWKSEKFYMAVGALPEIEGPVEQRYPDFVESAIAEVTEITSQAVAAKDAVFGMSAQAETLPAGTPASASYSQGVLTIGVPQGADAVTPSFSIGTVQSGETPNATITGTDENPVLNLTLPKGDQGDPGEPPEFGIGTVTTGQPGTEADVQISGVGGEYELSFTIPRGDTGSTGATGATGATPNLTIGTVQSGTTAAATITGTAESPVLNLTLPKGDKGDGDVSEVRGEKGLTGTVTDSGALKADLKSETTMHNEAQTPQDVTGRLYPVSLDANGKLVVSVPLPNVAVSDRFSMTYGVPSQTVDGSGKTYYGQTTNTIDLATSGATAGTYGPSQDVTGSNGAAINVPEITVDQYGRVTSVTNKILTCVDTQGDSLPTGGSTGQVLKKHSNTDGDVEWGSITESVTDVQLNGTSVVTSGVANVQVTGVPSGGTAGQVLKKNSGNTGLEWGSVDALPSGGTAGQVLKKNSGNTAAEWGGYSVPTGGSANQVLAKNSGTDGDLKWTTVSGGATSLGQLSDVTVPDAQAGDGIKYTGSQWIKGTPYKSYTTDDDGYGNPCIYDLDYIFSYHKAGYPIGVHDSIGIGDENPDYYVTDCKRCDDGNGNMGYVAELMRIKQNGKIEKRVFSQRYVNGEWVYSDETPTGMISNTETVTQAEYNALVSAGAIDSQTLYCIKESV